VPLSVMPESSPVPAPLSLPPPASCGSVNVQ
jgi:hypothetical protein